MTGAAPRFRPGGYQSAWYALTPAEKRAADELLYAHLLRTAVRGGTPAELKAVTKDVRSLQAIRGRLDRWSRLTPPAVRLSECGDGAWVALGARAPEPKPRVQRRLPKNAPPIALTDPFESKFSSAERAAMPVWLRDVV